MKTEYPTFTVERSESLEPNDQKAGDIYSRLGYRISDAIADLVDNAVDANASRVLVRFVRSAGGIHRVLLVDDGHGMNAETLREAMRFGSNVKRGSTQLGKYGIGLKSASLSQAEIVTVLSRIGRAHVGRRWTLANIKKRWSCEILQDKGIREAFRMKYGHVNVAKSGTIIVWERLEHLRALPTNIDAVLEKTIDELSVELGIRFHRFLEKARLKIAIDQHFVGEGEPETSRYVTPLNPFDYPASGHSDYPLTLKLDVDGTRVDVTCHIWPPKSGSLGYRLGGGKVALRQGFYFYRNDRVIQAGGWNGLRADDSEPHLSLARVEVDLPPALDSLFKLDVSKSHLDPSPHFFQALEKTTSNGIGISKYLEQAQAVYRRQKTKEGAKFPFAPGAGFSAKARKAIAEILDEKGTGRRRTVRFTWSQLDHDEVVRVDADRATILLNQHFKRELVEGRRRDAPVLKLTLMFLLQPELSKTFKKKTAAAWLQRVNHAMIASLKRG
jgi:hypothetical protein